MIPKTPRATQKILSVIIPVYNEATTLDELLTRVFAAELPERWGREVIVVDDASHDETSEVIERWASRLTLIRHGENQGKGASVADGLRRVSGDVAVIQDADLEYDPRDWMLMLAPIVEGSADVVFGSRFISAAPHRVLYFWHYFGNRLITSISNIFTNLNLTDMETCYKMFTREVVDSLKNRLVSRRFGIEPELTARVKRYRIYEVGISYHGRTYEQGKKIGWRDGVAALGHIIRFNLFL